MDACQVGPDRGRLIPLRTKAELDAKFETVEVYITQIKPRFANSSISYVLLTYGWYKLLIHVGQSTLRSTSTIPTTFYTSDAS